MRIRNAAAAALLTAAAPAVTAAPARTYCNLVPGRDGHEDPQETVLPGSTQDARIRSADVATNATHLTSVVRLRTTSTTDPTKPVQGMVLTFTFRVAGAGETYYGLVAELGREDDFWLDATTYSDDAAGPVRYERSVRRKVAGATGVFDTARAEVRVTVPLAAFGPRVVRPGTRIYALGAVVTRTWGDFDGGPPVVDDLYAGQEVDSAAAPWKVYYPAGARSCVPVGR